MRNIKNLRLLLGVFFLLACINVGAKPLHPQQAAVAAAHPLATQAGLSVLAKGGNAFDAAVTVSAVLAVVEPYSSGIGGGGFWLLHRAKDGHEVMIDGRETAPLAAHPAMYQDDQGNVVPGLSMNGALATGIPGEPAALVHIAEKYGNLPLSELLAPAIELAESGFPVDAIYRQMATFRVEALQASDQAAEIFLPEGQVPAEATLIRQLDLAKTLRHLASQGHDGFYAGDVAKKLVQGVREAGGIWTEQDLAQYKIVERAPVTGRYRNVSISSAALPSSGGIALIEILNQLEGFALSGLQEAELIHLVAEAMRRAYRDRAQYLGDQDFVDVPVGLLTDKAYAAGLRQSIRQDRATPSASLAPTATVGNGGNHTTHFSILDAEGNRVAATLSINYPFGSGFVPAGTGVLLNDEMDDFSAKPGVPNAYGLVGSHANRIEPGKRMLSSMSPTFLDDGNRVAIIGTPGGSRIITMVLLGTLAFTGEASAGTIVNLPRFHHQYLPDAIQFEPGVISDSAQNQLLQMGHQLKALKQEYGNMQLVIWNRKTGKVDAASDRRGIGQAVVLDSMPKLDIQ